MMVNQIPSLFLRYVFASPWEKHTIRNNYETLLQALQQGKDRGLCKHVEEVVSQDIYCYVTQIIPNHSY